MFLPDIKSIEVEDREDIDGVTVIHNEWTSDRAVPVIARRFVRPDQLRWHDHARWNEEKLRCDWHLLTAIFGENFQCLGQTLFREEEDSTIVLIEGNISIRVDQISSVPRFLGVRLGPEIERFIVSRLPSNLERTTTAIGRFLDTES